MPYKAPLNVMRFQNNERMISGPNAAPKPAHAYATKPRTLDSGFEARAIARRAMSNTIKRPIQTNSFCDADFRINDL